MSKTGKWIGEWLIVPLFGPPVWVLVKIYDLLFGPGELRRSKKREDRLARAVREDFLFLFNEYGAEIVPDAGTRHPQPFDYAMVIVVVGDLRLRFIRGRGELRIQVASKSSPNAWEELPSVLDLVDSDNPVSIRSFHFQTPPVFCENTWICSGRHFLRNAIPNFNSSLTRTTSATAPLFGSGKLRSTGSSMGTDRSTATRLVAKYCGSCLA